MTKDFYRLTSSKLKEVNIHAIDYPVFIIDTSYRVVEINQSASKAYGLLQETIIGRNLSGLLSTPEAVLNKLIAYDDRVSETVRLSSHYGDIYTANLRLKTIDDEGKVFFIVHVLNIKPVNKYELFVNDVFIHSLDAIAFVNEEEKVMMISKKFTDLLGYAEHEVLGKDLLSILRHCEDEDLTKENARARNGEVVTFNTIRQNKAGQLLHVNVTIVPSMVNGKAIGAQVVYRDIEKQMKQEDNLKTYQKIIDNYLDGVVIANKQKRITYFNQSYQKITGFNSKDLINKRFEFVNSKVEDNSSKMSYIWQHLAERNMWQGEMWSRHKNGTLLPLWLQVFVLRDEKNQVLKYVAIYKDLGDIESMNKKLLMILGKDPLTSTYNRTYFFEKFEKETVEHPKDKYKIVFMDIDDFKDVNDIYGHAVGDSILLEFSKRLLYLFEDGIVSRYGGDEFVIAIKANDEASFNQKMNLFNELMQTPIVTKDGEFNLNVSVGYSSYPKDSKNVTELIHEADLNMYQVKRSKKIVVSYDE